MTNEAAKDLSGAPYKIVPKGGKFQVVNNLGLVKATFDSEEKARQYQKALYKNVPGAAKVAEKKPWTGDAKRRTAAELFPHVFIRKQMAAVTDGGFLRCAGCGLSKGDIVHAEAPIALPGDDELDPISGLPYHGYEAASSTQDDAPCEVCGFGSASMVHHKPPANATTPDDAEEMLAVSEVAKTKKGKHHFVHPRSLIHSAGWYGPGVCAACGKPADDPDHDGDVDDPGATTDNDPVMKAAVEPAPAQLNPAHVQITDRTPELDDVEADLSSERAFVTEVNGKMLLTAPAYMVPPAFEKAQSPNNFMRYMAGRLVGGEQANRNGAFWSTGDLEFGMPTVAHGPLNWLHEAKHIIGSITGAQLVKPSAEQAADGMRPHIEAMSGIWAWVYPQEAEVIEQASDQGKLWYSMECVSNDVECVGDNGCGAKVGYLDYIKNAAGSCQHMKQRAGAERRFAEPTFLGAAVIVPPVRPGWADANASLMKQAAALSEKAYEQAGKPDMPAAEWELLMARVLVYAGLE